MSVEILGHYNSGLVMLSVAIAVLASYCAFELAGRVQMARGRRRWLWLMGGAVVMGSGIWALPFVAILALHLTIPVHYQVTLTIASLVYAIAASGLALWLMSRPKLAGLYWAIGSLCMGLAIVDMHYMGMTAMQIPARVVYDWPLVLVSVAIAIVAAGSALRRPTRLWQFPATRTRQQKAHGTLIMSVAISGIHYTGMAATHFIPLAQLTAATPAPAPTDSPSVAILIGLIALSLLSGLLALVVVDQRAKTRSMTTVALRQSEQRFRQLVQDMHVGVVLFDWHKHGLICNQAALNLF